MTAMAEIFSIKAKFVDTRFKADNGYIIGIYTTRVKNLPERFRGDRKKTIQFSAKGMDLPTSKKYDIILKGTLSIHPNYGLNMTVSESEIVKPTSEDGIINYLCDFVEGVGIATAKKIVKKFGSKTLEILEKEPEKIKEVKGVRNKTAKKAISSFEDMKKYAELSEMLAPYDISSKRIKLIYHHFADKNKSAVDVIKENPFVLSEIYGFGFLSMDKLREDFGLSPISSDRIRNCIKYILKQAEKNEGHLCLPQKELIARVQNLLNENLPDAPITKKMIGTEMVEMAKANVHELLGNNGYAYLPDNFIYEDKTAKKIALLVNEKKVVRDYDRYISIAEKSLAIDLSKSQRDAVKTALRNQFSIITGGAGTGKTTVLKVILKTLYKMGLDSTEVLLCAPTGKAAQRMKESTSHSAFTIHSALGINAGEAIKVQRDEEISELPYKLVVVDESSMCDMEISYMLFSSINPQKTKVIFLGDTGQLPSVGAGNVLHELIGSGMVPVTELNVIYRQRKENYIVGNAYNIRHGIQKVNYNDDFVFFEQKSPVVAAEDIANMYVNAVFYNGIENVQVLSPLRDKGECSVYALNTRIQNLINPKDDNKVEVNIGSRTFRENDRIIQTRNSQKRLRNSLIKKDKNGSPVEVKTVSVFNGEIGTLKSITRDENKQYIFTVDFGYGRTVELERDEMYDVDLSYAMTIHRSQGSEYKTVIIPLLNYFSDKILFRNLLYTGVTRAKERCIIVGSEQVIHKCIRVDRIVLRNTQLAWRVKNEIQSEREYIKKLS